MNPKRGVLLIVLLAGCGSAASVSGTITYNGSPVADGYITFFPTGPGASEAAAPIRNGVYQLESIPIGKRMIEIVSSAPADAPISSAELEAKAKTKSKAAPPPAAEFIPGNAVGNRQAVEIVPGKQTLDFHLKKP